MLKSSIMPEWLVPMIAIALFTLCIAWAEYRKNKKIGHISQKLDQLSQITLTVIIFAAIAGGFLMFVFYTIEFIARGSHEKSNQYLDSDERYEDSRYP